MNFTGRVESILTQIPGRAGNDWRMTSGMTRRERWQGALAGDADKECWQGTPAGYDGRVWAADGVAARGSVNGEGPAAKRWEG